MAEQLIARRYAYILIACIRFACWRTVPYVYHFYEHFFINFWCHWFSDFPDVYVLVIAVYIKVWHYENCSCTIVKSNDYLSVDFMFPYCIVNFLFVNPYQGYGSHYPHTCIGYVLYIFIWSNLERNGTHADSMSKMFCKIDVQYGVVHKKNSGIPPYCKYFTLCSYCS